MKNKTALRILIGTALVLIALGSFLGGFELIPVQLSDLMFYGGVGLVVLVFVGALVADLVVARRKRR